MPGDALANYQSDKSITADIIKSDPSKYFKKRTSEATIQPGKIRFGRMADKASPTQGLLGSGEQEKKTLLGA